MEREMVKEHTLTLMETSMKGNGRMGNIMVKEHTLLKMEVPVSYTHLTLPTIYYV